MRPRGVRGHGGAARHHPAPYLARAQWVALETEDALSVAELKQRLRNSYDLVFARLPRKTREALAHYNVRASLGLTRREPYPTVDQRRSSLFSRAISSTLLKGFTT